MTPRKAIFNIQSDVIHSCQHGAPREEVKVMIHLPERWLPVPPLAAESFSAPFYLAPLAHPFPFKDPCGSLVRFSRRQGDETFWATSCSTFWSCLTDEALTQLSKVHSPKALQADQSSLWHSANLTQVIIAPNRTKSLSDGALCAIKQGPASQRFFFFLVLFDLWNKEENYTHWE